MFNTTVFRTTERHQHIHMPDTIKEVKAPTDDSIRLLNEMQQGVIDNIMAKVEVKDNLLKGECYLIDTRSMGRRHPYLLVMKFSINGQEFVVEKDIEEDDVSWNDREDIRSMTDQCRNYTNAVMMWFAVNKLPEIIFKQVMQEPVPRDFGIRNISR